MPVVSRENAVRAARRCCPHHMSVSSRSPRLQVRRICGSSQILLQKIAVAVRNHVSLRMASRRPWSLLVRAARQDARDVEYKLRRWDSPSHQPESECDSGAVKRTGGRNASSKCVVISRRARASVPWSARFPRATGGPRVFTRSHCFAVELRAGRASSLQRVIGAMPISIHLSGVPGSSAWR